MAVPSQQAGTGRTAARFRLGFFRRSARERIYIVPTFAGLALAGFVLLVFVLGYFVQGFGGPAQMLVIALAVAGIVVLIETNENLRGIELRLPRTEPVRAGDPANVQLTVSNQSTRERFGLRVRARAGFRLIGRAPMIPVLAPGETVTVPLTLPGGPRGMRPLPDLWVSSTFPAALCLAWKVFQGVGQIAVYPRGRSWRPLAGCYGNAGSEDVGGRKPYSAGDPPVRIDWKAYARRESLEIRAADANDGIPIRWQDTAFLPDPEDRLAQLSAWLDTCETQRLRFRFELGPESGDQSSLPACRTALARFDTPSHPPESPR